MSERPSASDAPQPEFAGGEPRLVGRTRHTELTLDELADLQPGLGRLMPDVSERYWILYYAAKGGNWKLAQYCVNQIRGLFRVGSTTRPNMRRYLEAFDHGHLRAIEAAIAQRDVAAFETAYRKGIDGANAMHAATNHPEVVWQLPPEPPRHLYLGPVDTDSAAEPKSP